MTNNQITIEKITRSARRTMSLHITDNGGVEVRAPYLVPLFVIRQFVSSHVDWIRRAQKSVANYPKYKAREITHGASIVLAGQTHIFHVTDGNSIVLAGNKILFPRRFLKHGATHMRHWCRKYAKVILTERLGIYTKKMGVSYKRISIRDTKTRWGSCSSSGTISFAYRLVFADMDVIDYVVVHELAHVTHRNHSSDFWRRVELFYPDYKVARMRLRKEGHTYKV